ncbi:MAG: DUF5343 domain-containing protein [Acidobacteria bacterium]|nr:DUF5343 domain-containing protein [Acidobacteriota bacterium]
MAESEDRVLPPYVPYRTFVNFLDSLGNVVMPSHIDKGVMSSMSGGMQALLRSSLKSMGLIDAEGRPRERFEELVKSRGEERKAALRELFNSTYTPLLKGKIDLQTTTTPKLKQAFADLGATGETVDKCAAFLMALAKDAGFTLSPHLRRAAPRRRARGARPSAATNSPHIAPADQDLTDTDRPPVAAMQRTITLPSGGSLTLSGSFNLFALKGDERDLVFGIIDKMVAFEETHQGQGGDRDD